MRLFDDAVKAATISTMVLMTAGAPAFAQGQWQTFNYADGSGSINVPSGWTFQGSQAGETHVSGPHGEMIMLGMPHGMVQRPLPGNPDWIGVSPYISDPVQAFVMIMRHDFPDVKPLSVQRISPTAVYMHYQASAQGVLYRAFGYMQTFNVDGNMWYLTTSTAAARASDWASSFPTMMAIWASHRFNGSQPWANIARAAGTGQSGSGSTGPNESQRSRAQQLTTMGHDLIEDTQTHTRFEVGQAKADQTVNEMNERAGWARYRVVPVNEY